MIRYTIFLAVVAGFAATAIAKVEPVKTHKFEDPTAITVAYKSTADQLAMLVPARHTILQKCALEDCSDTPQ